MGQGKKEAVRKERLGVKDGMANVKVKGENFYRSAKKVKVLNILKEGKPQRNASGDITKAATFQSREKPNARIEPNRKWFGNTRVIAQNSLDQFRQAVAAQKADPYSYLLKQNKLPMSLINDNDSTKNGIKQHKAKIAVDTRPFSDTFGPKSKRKRVKLDVSSLEDLAGHSEKMHDEYTERREQAQLLSGALGQETGPEITEENHDTGEITMMREPIFSKGQSRRIFNELYKVIDSSDVLLHVLDARDPEGTRCRSVEKYLREEAPHKHLVFILNKCDLIPTSVAAAWVRILSKEHPTLAFHASLTNSFGKGTLIQLLRQFSALHSNRKQVTVGMIGYPNSGKSSVINTLKKKMVCKTAPIPGETKVWQYITLMKRIYMIDCPGVVPPSQTDEDQDILLRGALRIEQVENPAQYVAAVLKRCKTKHVERTYGIKDYTDAIDFLDRLARKYGKLLKGGEADADTVAKMVLNDYMRGKIPWFIPPPGMEERAMLGKSRGKSEMMELNKVPTADLRGSKRKRDDIDAEEEDVEDDEKQLELQSEPQPDDESKEDIREDEDDEDEDGIAIDQEELVSDEDEFGDDEMAKSNKSL